MRTMKLSDIKISNSFANTTPRENKMNECRKNWKNWHGQDRYIVVNTDGVLIDGYIQYLVLKENNIEEAEVKISNRRKKRWYRKNTYEQIAPKYMNEPTVYVYGIHPKEEKRKERIWRVPKSWTNFADIIRVGDSIKCCAKHGKAPVIVTRIEVLDQCPVDFRVKRVACKKIIRNGQVIEFPFYRRNLRSQ